MARRRRASTGKEEWLRPLFGLVLLGLIYVAFQIGLLDLLGRKLMEPLQPKGPMNAGEIYREQMRKRSAD